MKCVLHKTAGSDTEHLQVHRYPRAANKRKRCQAEDAQSLNIQSGRCIVPCLQTGRHLSELNRRVSSERLVMDPPRSRFQKLCDQRKEKETS